MPTRMGAFKISKYSNKIASFVEKENGEQVLILFSGQDEEENYTIPPVSITFKDREIERLFNYFKESKQERKECGDINFEVYGSKITRLVSDEEPFKVITFNGKEKGFLVLESEVYNDKGYKPAKQFNFNLKEFSFLDQLLKAIFNETEEEQNQEESSTNKEDKYSTVSGWDLLK